MQEHIDPGWQDANVRVLLLDQIRVGTTPIFIDLLPVTQKKRKIVELSLWQIGKPVTHLISSVVPEVISSAAVLKKGCRLIRALRLSSSVSDQMSFNWNQGCDLSLMKGRAGVIDML